ncbi:MAG: hypothetical protein JJ863_07760 [Deltaproteobacteria bacterium]|nr:hypothetical protein [Deltaproteobacteria bacterium]
MSVSRRTGWLFLGLSLVACTGTETGNPPFDGDSYTSAPLVASTDPADEPSVLVDQVFVSFAGVRVLSGEVCARVSTEQGAEGRVASLLAGASLGELPATDDACGVRVELAVAEAADDVPESLVGAMIWIHGERADGAPVEIRIASIEAWELRAPAPFVLREGTILALDLATLVENAAVLDAAPDPDGVVRLDELAAGSAVLAASGLFADVDEDGRISDPDRASGDLAHHD